MGDRSCDRISERPVSILISGETVKVLAAIWEGNMGEKLQQGDRFPSLTLKLVQGGTVRLPDEMPTRYAAVLFYRGHW
jgi:hypothetical protein